jgi:hypothetical protein
MADAIERTCITKHFLDRNTFIQNEAKKKAGTMGLVSEFSVFVDGKDL